MDKAKKQYQWNSLYIEFLQSDHATAASFLRAKNIVPTSGNARRQTAGWTQKRHQIGIKALRGVEQELEAQLSAVSRKKKWDACTLALHLYPMLATMLQRRAMGKEGWEKHVKEHYTDKGKLPPMYWENEFAFAAVWRAVTTDLGEPTHNIDRPDRRAANMRGKLNLADIVELAAEEKRAQKTRGIAGVSNK